MNAHRPLPSLPLLLWKTPPSLAAILGQDGVAHRVVRDPSPLSFSGGRFVLFDGRSTRRDELRRLLKPEHVPIDVHALRSGFGADPFGQWSETASRGQTWRIRGVEVTERVSRHDRARLRARLIDRLRAVVTQAGGVWARLSAYPHPYRSAFNLRVDLDEPNPADYFAFARARRPIEDATTHFVSTHAYGHDRAVLDDLRPLDTHSHGHHHATYREPEANRVNLRRAAERLFAAGIDGSGFASPHGVWNPGLNAELEGMGFRFSSEFQVGYDDYPFFPTVGDRASTVLQVPVHPICEGLFFDAGAGPESAIEHLVGVVRAKLAAGEPAFVYGHPERRLGRFPEIVSALAEAVADAPTTWRVGLGAFADWWRWRLSRSWSLALCEGVCRVQVDDWDARYPLGLEVIRGRDSALIAIDGPVTTFRADDLDYERRPAEYAPPESVPSRRRVGLKQAVRDALDWETATPVEDLTTGSVRSRLKRELRLWRERSRRAG